MKIITISGLDGSGKSTQIELTKNYLESQGKKVFYFHAIEFGLANRIKNNFFCHSERSRGISGSSRRFAPQDDIQNKSVTKASWLQIQLRKLALFIDLIRFKKLLKKLEKENFDYLISDRYFYDTIINIEYLSSYHSERSRGISGSSRRFAPQDDIPMPDVSIYLQADPELIMQRDRKPDQGIEYLQKKKELYDAAAPIFSLKIINGNRNKEEIFEEILSVVCD